MASQSPRVQVCDDLQAATDEALRHVLQAARTAVEGRGHFFLALAGGETPSGLYTRLGEPSQHDTLAWDRFEVFFTDERCVAPDDPQSNYGMIKRTLLDHAPIPASNVHRIQGEIDATAAAAAYDAELRRAFDASNSETPRFDFILLGMGPDGHTASLFPHSAALEVADRLAVPNYAETLKSQRITLTAPILNAARDVVFLVSGAEKAEALAAVLEGPHNPQSLPAQIVQPTSGRLRWLADRAAASRLRGYE